jgi:CheY-like chemotaxis protein
MTKILIVDDDEAFLYQYEQLLTQYGFKVQTVINAIDIFENIETFRPNLIILDTFINDYDGRTIGKMLKLTESTKQIPVILCSVDVTIGNNAYHQYANLFISKPFEIEELVRAIKSLTSIHA